VSRKAIRVVPFEPWHAAKIKLREFDAKAFADMGISPAAYAAIYVRGSGFSGVLDDGEVVACGGIVIPWPGSGHAWALTSELVEDYTLTFHKTFKRMIAFLEREHGLRRIETPVHAQYVVSQRWLKRLGFRPESLMRRWLGGEDYYQYVRLAS
jgi:RimJ/RimL family protein N-acetyltransferase